MAQQLLCHYSFAEGKIHEVQFGTKVAAQGKIECKGEDFPHRGEDFTKNHEVRGRGRASVWKNFCQIAAREGKIIVTEIVTETQLIEIEFQ